MAHFSFQKAYTYQQCCCILLQKKNKRNYSLQWFFIIRSTKCRNFFFANPLFVAVEFHLRRHLALEIVISLVGCFDVSQSRVQLVVQGRRKREGHKGHGSPQILLTNQLIYLVNVKTMRKTFFKLCVLLKKSEL